jgi:predicted RNA binding protein with dsRBD fold (UPF0201 family)
MAQAGRPFDEDFLGQAPKRTKVRTRHQKKMLLSERRPAEKPFRHVALRADVRIYAPLFETEDPSAVRHAVLALFPDAQFEGQAAGGGLEATAHDLARFAEVVRHSRIRDTAREVLKHAVDAQGVLRFRLNKQAAAAARVNFVGPREVLGELAVEVRCDEPDFLAEELTWIEGESDQRLLGTKLHTVPPRRAK